MAQDEGDEPWTVALSMGHQGFHAWTLKVQQLQFLQPRSASLESCVVFQRRAGLAGNLEDSPQLDSKALTLMTAHAG